MVHGDTELVGTVEFERPENEWEGQLQQGQHQTK